MKNKILNYTLIIVSFFCGIYFGSNVSMGLSWLFGSGGDGWGVVMLYLLIDTPIRLLFGGLFVAVSLGTFGSKKWKINRFYFTTIIPVMLVVLTTFIYHNFFDTGWVTEKVLNSKNEWRCNLLLVGRDECRSEWIINYGNKNMCSDLESTEQDFCYSYFAITSHDITLCSKVKGKTDATLYSGGNTHDQCVFRVITGLGISLPKNGCDLMLSNKNKVECQDYYNRQIKTWNISF